MAGLGESCSHVAAVLFYLEYAVRIQGNKTVTQDKAYWMPPTLKEVEYSEIKDIDFMSSKSMKHKMDKRLHQKQPAGDANMRKLLKKNIKN